MEVSLAEFRNVIITEQIQSLGLACQYWTGGRIWGGDFASYPITGKYPHLKKEDDLPIAWVCERKEGLIEIIYMSSITSGIWWLLLSLLCYSYDDYDDDGDVDDGSHYLARSL